MDCETIGRLVRPADVGHRIAVPVSSFIRAWRQAGGLCGARGDFHPASREIKQERSPSDHILANPIRYQAGGLDEKPIRTLVCNILEGGEMAFRDGARRLRIALKR